MIITSSEQIHVTVHVGTNMLIFNLVLTISPQIPGGQPCSRADTEEIKYLNYNIKYLSYNLVCIFYQNYALNILGEGDGKRKKLHCAIRGDVCVGTGHIPHYIPSLGISIPHKKMVE